MSSLERALKLGACALIALTVGLMTMSPVAVAAAEGVAELPGTANNPWDPIAYAYCVIEWIFGGSGTECVTIIHILESR